MESFNFPVSYFKNRMNNDIKRQLSFALEKKYIFKHLKINYLKKKKILDVGCSTGEFIKFLFHETNDFNECDVYGIEPSTYASKIANKNKIKIIEDIREENFFDIIIFRGTIQYISNPFEIINNAYKALKPGGKIIFLATPNTRSIYFYLFKTLPFLEDEFMFWLPSDSNLKLLLKNLGFKLIDINYPYFKSPYSSFYKDIFSLFFKLFTGKGKFPFPGSMLWLIAEK